MVVVYEVYFAHTEKHSHQAIIQKSPPYKKIQRFLQKIVFLKWGIVYFPGTIPYCNQVIVLPSVVLKMMHISKINVTKPTEIGLCLQYPTVSNTPTSYVFTSASFC